MTLLTAALRHWLAMPTFVLLICLAAGQAGSAASPAEKGRQIASSADAADSGWRDARVMMQMVLSAPNGQRAERVLAFEALEGDSQGAAGGDRSLLVFQSPKDVRETALLTHNQSSASDDQWIYLPALKRVKRISSSSRAGPFMGSEFAYEDFTAAEIDKFTYSWLRDEACPGEPQARCHVLDRIPAYEGSGYSRQTVWMHSTDLRIVQIDYFDLRAKKLKTLSARSWKQYDGSIWRAHSMEMVNHQTGKSTVLNWGPYSFGAGLAASDFDQSRLMR